MREELVTLSDGCRLWTYVSGVGEPILFLNGGPGMADYLAPVGELLDGFAVHRYEQRGCNRSEAREPFTVARFVADMEELRVHWGFERWLVLGHSWGVDLGLAYGVTHPARVRGVIGLAGGRVVNDRGWHQIYAGRRHLEELPPSAAPPSMETNAALNADWKEWIHRPSLFRELADAPFPVRFIYPENDIRPSWPTRQLAELMPDASFTLIEGADHNLWQGAPDALRAALREAIAALPR
jgi:proline iminopeptidase